MGVYINGMEMPRNCDDCRLDIDCAYDESQDGYKMIGGRPRKCPLVPAADVRPVVWAYWKSVPHKRARVCSRCEADEPYKFADDDANVYNYCPNCGANMREKS